MLHYKFIFIILPYLLIISQHDPITACKKLGGNYRQNTCIYPNLMECIKHTHINKYKKNCSKIEYFLDKCKPTKEVIKYWCPQYPNCVIDDDCTITNKCIQNKCMFNGRQPYCILVKENMAILECD